MAAPKRSNPDRIIDAAMAVAAREGWRRVSLGDIAAEAKVTLAQLHAIFHSKQAIIDALVERIDAKVLEQDAEAEGEPARERLVDVLMRRFEALNPHKQAISSILRDLGPNPASMLCAMPRLMRSMSWSLEAAGIRTAGPLGRLRVRGLAAIYVSAMFVWLRDDSADIGRTMAHLDRSLRRAERIIGAFPRRRGISEAEEPPKAEPAPA